jgi:hypothetical protein
MLDGVTMTLQEVSLVRLVAKECGGAPPTRVVVCVSSSQWIFSFVQETTFDFNIFKTKFYLDLI